MNLKTHGRKYPRFIQHLEGLLEAAEAKCPKEVLGSVGSWSCSLSLRRRFLWYTFATSFYSEFSVSCGFSVCVCAMLYKSWSLPAKARVLYHKKETKERIYKYADAII